MSNAAIIGLLVLLFVIVGGMLATAALARAAYPLRRRMFEHATSLLGRSGLTRDDRLFLQFCMDHALSFRAGWIPLRAVWRAIAGHRGGRGDQTRTEGESAVTSVGVRFMLSVLLANPIAFILFLPSVLILMILEREAVRPAVRQTATKLPTSYDISLV